jgi:hypothetical protein
VPPTSPANLAALLMVLAAAALIALTAIAVRPAPKGPVATSTQAAPGPKPRAHGRAPSSARRTPRRGTGRRTARAAAPTPTPPPTLAPVVPPEAAAPVPEPEPAASSEPAPQEAATTPPPQPPETVVQSYYRALDAGRFEAAWTILTPAVRASFGPFENWRAGYETTLSNSPRDIEVASEGSVATIAHELVTEDRSSCGPVERRFAVRWKLVHTDGGWRAAGLTAEKRSGGEPGDACPGRHDPAGGTGGARAS